jgi:WD40 repeat protein
MAFWSPDGHTLATVNDDHTVGLWDVNTGKEVRRLAGHEGVIYWVKWSPDGKGLASESEQDRTVRLWDVARGKEVRCLDGYRGPRWSPDGALFLAWRKWDESIVLWDTVTGKRIRSFQPWDAVADEEIPDDKAIRGSDVPEAIWSPDGKLLASWSLRQPVLVWDPGTGKVVRRIRVDGITRDLTWSPDGMMLASMSWQVSGNGEGTVTYDFGLWEVASGKEARHLVDHDGSIPMSLAWSPDSKTLATESSTGIVRFWDVATGALVRHSGNQEGGIALCWSPDGRRLASARRDTTVLIWAVPRGPNESSLHLNGSDLQGCWTDLADPEPAKAYGAIGKLTRAAKQSVPFLEDRLQPVTAPDPQHVSQLVQDLESNEFSVRQRATEELHQLGEIAEPSLRQALAKGPSLESQRRLEDLLEKLNRWSGERLRAQRATKVLETIGTAEARKVLEGQAKGRPGAQLTQEAKAALERLAKLRSSSP